MRLMQRIAALDATGNPHVYTKEFVRKKTEIFLNFRTWNNASDFLLHSVFSFTSLWPKHFLYMMFVSVTMKKYQKVCLE